MIPVSPEFQAAQDSDSAAPAYLVNLVLSDYAASMNGATVTSSGDDGSGDYPAAGAINSDHTEINVGAATTADNGIGLASWKSSVAPNGTGNVWLEIDFGQARTFNRVRLYNLAADPLTSYVLQYWDGANWVSFAGSPDQYNSGMIDVVPYGGGSYDVGLYGGVAPGSSPDFGYTGGLDSYLFASITSTKIRCVVYSTTSAGKAQIVEIEVYRLVDITSRVRVINGPDRRKDFKLQQPIAAQEIITVDNKDKFFAISYVPTAAEVAAGYVNSELLQLGISLEVNEGFYTTAGIELRRTFTGSIDSILPVAGAAECEIVARDGIKWLTISTDSCKLKSAIYIEDFLRYVLNRQNISDYEMVLGTTGITLPVAFYYETSILTTIQLLLQSAGDAIFFFDEYGWANMQFYLTATPQQKNYATASDWATGTLTNIDNTAIDGSIRREWFVIDDFADHNYNTNPKWTLLNGAGTSVSAASGNLVTGGNVNPGNGQPCLSTPFAQIIGSWYFQMKSGNSIYPVGYYFLMDSNSTDGYGNPQGHGYFIQAEGTVGTLYQTSGGGTALLASWAIPNGAFNEYMVTRDSNSQFTVYLNNGGWSQVAQVTNSVFHTGKYLIITGFNLTFGQAYYSPAILLADSHTNAQAVWESGTIDRSAGVSQNGVFSASSLTPAGTAVAFFTSASSDGITWDAWVAVSPGSQDPCAVKRYEKIRVVMTTPQDSGTNATPITPIVYSLSVSWYTGTGQQKWSPTVGFYLTDQNGILDVQQQVSDSLGGDTAIINDIAVTAAPLVLSGGATDTQWQGTAGTISPGIFDSGPPPSYVGTFQAAPSAADIAVATPLIVSVGTVSFICVIPAGMDISGMAGGSCIAITWGTATGTASISYIHPTTPVLTLVVTNPGTITDLRLIGKSYSNIKTPYQSVAHDLASRSRYRKRHQDIQNDYVQNGVMTGVIAARIIENQKDPTVHIPSLPIFPPIVNMQPADRVNVVNGQTGIDKDYYVVGFSRTITLSPKKADASMSLILMNIPTA